MTWWGWLMFGTAALWLAPGSLWRPCALALLLQWGIAEIAYRATGDRLPLPIYILGDVAVIAAFVLRPSHWTDWLVVVPYPVVWWLYTLEESRAQARRELTIMGEFLSDLTGFLRSRLPMTVAHKAAG